MRLYHVSQPARMVSDFISHVDEIDGFNIITPDFLSQLSPARLKETAQPNNKPKLQNFRPKALPLPCLLMPIK